MRGQTAEGTADYDMPAYTEDNSNLSASLHHDRLAMTAPSPFIDSTLRSARPMTIQGGRRRRSGSAPSWQLRHEPGSPINNNNHQASACSSRGSLILSPRTSQLLTGEDDVSAFVNTGTPSLSSSHDTFLRGLLQSQPIDAGGGFDDNYLLEQRVQSLLRSMAPAGSSGFTRLALSTTAPAALRSRPSTWGQRRDAACASLRKERPLTVTGAIEGPPYSPSRGQAGGGDETCFQEVLRLSTALDHMGQTLAASTMQEQDDVARIQHNLHAKIEVGWTRQGEMPFQSAYRLTIHECFS